MNGILLMLGSDVAFAAMAAATKFTGRRLSAVEIVFVRSVIGAAALLCILANRKIPLKANEPALLWGRGIVGYVALQCYFWSIPRITLGTAVMLNYTAPIFAVLLSFFLLRERPPLGVKISLLFSFIGVCLLSSPEIAGEQAAILAALGSGFLAGAVHVMIRQGNKTDAPLLIIFYFTVSSTIGSGLLLIKTGWAAPTPAEWAGLFIVATSSLIGQMGLTYSLQKAPVWVVSPFGYFTPVLGLFLGHAIWKETLSTWQLAGGALVIVCGTVMLSFFRRLALPFR